MKSVFLVLITLLAVASLTFAQEAYSGRLFPTGTGTGAVISSGDSTTYWLDMKYVNFATICYNVSTLGASTDMDVTLQVTYDGGDRVHTIGIVDTLITGDVAGCLTLAPGTGTSMLTNSAAVVTPHYPDYSDFPVVTVAAPKVRLLFNKTAGTATDSLFVSFYAETSKPNSSLAAAARVP